MDTNVCQQVCSKIKQSNPQASNQLDESTHITLESDLVALAQYQKKRRNAGRISSSTISCQPQLMQFM